jgi:hypothetical protein
MGIHGPLLFDSRIWAIFKLFYGVCALSLAAKVRVVVDNGCVAAFLPMLVGVLWFTTIVTAAHASKCI